MHRVWSYYDNGFRLLRLPLTLLGIWCCLLFLADAAVFKKTASRHRNKYGNIHRNHINAEWPTTSQSPPEARDRFHDTLPVDPEAYMSSVWYFSKYFFKNYSLLFKKK